MGGGEKARIVPTVLTRIVDPRNNCPATLQGLKLSKWCIFAIVINEMENVNSLK